MRALIPLLLLLPLLAHAAAPLPPSLQTLQTALQAAEANLATLNQTIAIQRKTHQHALAKLNATTFTLLRLGNWPAPLLHSQSLLGGSIPAAPVRHSLGDVGTLLRTTQTRLATQQAAEAKRLESYLQLRTQAQTKLAELTQLQTTFSTQRKRLNKQQQQTLRLAALDAQNLAQQLQETPKTLPSPLPAPKAYRPTPNALTPVSGAATPSGEGTLYATRPSASVVATLTGTVAYAGPFQNLGGLVITESPDGIYTVYAGLGSLTVNEGQTLQTGSTLGAMPATSHPTLYFEIRRNGRPLALESLRK